MSPRLVFLLSTVTIDAMGIGLILPVMPDLIREVSGGTLADAALWGGVLSTLYALMQFLFAPLMGHLSDIHGRRPVLLITLAVMVVDYVVMALAQTLWLLLAARALGGLAAATQSTASAALADITPPQDRARRFGLIGAAFGLGFVLGPLLGGLLGELGTRAPFWAAAALAGANALLGLVVLPETVGAARPRFTLGRANPLGVFLSLSRLDGVRRGLVLFFLYQLAFATYPAVWAYFVAARYGWDAGMTGLSLGLFGISMALVQGVLIGPVLTRCGPSGTVLAGLLFSALSFAAILWAPTGPLALAIVPLAALGALFGPAIQGVMSARLGPDRQGELQGALGAAAAVSMVLAPLVMTRVFAHFTAPGAEPRLAGAPFALALGLVLLALVLFLRPERPRAVT
ncbi:MFS transporter [Pseudoponticoccus marisrubri]|uniref:MFS transporter n=1 Tax=Pseudoponticoccus marisrubri TaxID=1685382 RepID=A0A0W7WGD0_9RHOB|nr:MFS transporter [Pseudoponticoccus marisrubri]KUF09658.1 MFS transporter [Pseudoponticoccus marisrubri]